MLENAMDSRKYIDMIYRTSARLPNWNPSNPMKPGDYGDINAQSGEFDRHGNIYNTPEIIAKVPALKTHECEPHVGAMDDEMVICGENTTSTDFEMSGDADAGTFANASLKLEFNTTEARRGAFLVMTKPQTTSLPGTIPMRDLAMCKTLQGKHLVTEVTTCQAYVMCLTGKKKEQIRVALLGQIPLPFGAGNVGGNANMKWWADRMTGLFRNGCSQEGQVGPAGFDTLMKLKIMSPPWVDWFFRPILRRDSPPLEPKEDNIWSEASIPWCPLDDDGVEEEMEDTVFDD